MHVIILNLAYDPICTTPEALLTHYFSLTGWAEGVKGAGAQVTVFQRYPQSAPLAREGVAYEFVADGYGPVLRGWQQPWGLYGRVKRAAVTALRAGVPVLIHLNGLLFPVQAGILSRLLPRACALVIQHHAERPWPAAGRRLQRWGLQSAEAFLFATQALAAEWRATGLISLNQPVYEVMETSSLLTYEDRAAARAQTGLAGRPVIFWAGSLYPNKDPLTVLEGFELALAQLPQAHLYMAYLYDNLLPQVQARLEGSPRLKGAVTLLGRIPYAEIGSYYNSADLFVQGSHHEGSGIALLDALACGVVPVVTDIPSFRAITANGQVGALWPPGEAPALAAALLDMAHQPLAQLSRQARCLFQEQWHFSALGRRAVEVYREVVERKGVSP